MLSLRSLYVLYVRFVITFKSSIPLLCLFLFACSIICWEKGAEVSLYDYEFISFEFWSLLFVYFEVTCIRYLKFWIIVTYWWIYLFIIVNCLSLSLAMLLSIKLSSDISVLTLDFFSYFINGIYFFTVLLWVSLCICIIIYILSVIYCWGFFNHSQYYSLIRVFSPFTFNVTNVFN